MNITGKSFVSSDTVARPKCGGNMYLIRRGRHAKFGVDWEQQIFACSKCHNEIERSADTDGKPHAA